MKKIDKCVLELTARIDNTIYKDHKNDLLKMMDKLTEIQAIENAHKQEMARIKASKPNMAAVMGRLLNWIIYDLYGSNECDEIESKNNE
ncbi:MAG: hypothetical protein FWC75_09485 [Oscillospiraceae bacterium]|nr:hypothetical protein [Oscillospiraceae bacterium]